MAMKKYTQSESIEVLRGKEAQVLNDHFEKTGKASLSAFSAEEKKNVLSELNSITEEKSGQDPEEKQYIKQLRHSNKAAIIKKAN